MVPLGHFGPLVVNITHTRHRSNIFHLVPKLVSKLGKNGGPFFKLQPAPRKTPSTHPSEKHFVHCCGQPAFSKIQSTARTLNQSLIDSALYSQVAGTQHAKAKWIRTTYISLHTRRRFSLVKLDLKLGPWESPAVLGFKIAPVYPDCSQPEADLHHSVPMLLEAILVYVWFSMRMMYEWNYMKLTYGVSGDWRRSRDEDFWQGALVCKDQLLLC